MCKWTFEMFWMCILCVIAVKALMQVWAMRRLPPGPWALPIVGYLPFLGIHHKTFCLLHKCYGAIFSIYVGNRLTVVICDNKLLRLAFSKEELTGRPNTPLMQIIEGLGIINSEGQLWEKQRRFLHEKLRSFGINFMGSGKKVMGEKIKTEVTDLIAMLRSSGGAPVDPNPFLTRVVSNVISGITMSVRFTAGDERFKRHSELVEEGMRLFGEAHYSDFIPLYKYLPGQTRVQKKIAENRAEMFQFYQDLIDEHRLTLDTTKPRDIIDAYIIASDAELEGSPGALNEGDLQLKQVLGDLFSAGTETIKTGLLWSLVHMLRNPEVKRRVQEEIDAVIGCGRMATVEDMVHMPYTETTIMETLRISSIVPLGTTHSPTKDVYLGGYLIPAGTQVIPFINCIHMDPNLWDEPAKFNPSRFIDASGKIQRPAHYMPFGVGRRMCMGDVLARMEMFMFFTNMMQNFDVEVATGDAMPSLDGIAGVTVAPKPFRVRFLPRTQRHVGAL